MNPFGVFLTGAVAGIAFRKPVARVARSAARTAVRGAFWMGERVQEVRDAVSDIAAEEAQADGSEDVPPKAGRKKSSGSD